MPGPDSLADLAADLRALSGRERRAVLGALSDSERLRLTALLESAADPPDRESEGDGYDSFSPWLTARLRDAPKDGSAGTAAPWRMTAAARQLLQQAAQDVLDLSPADGVAGHRGGSLIEALTALFLPRRQAR